MNKKIHDLLYRNLFPMLKHYIEILIRKYFQECLSPTFTKSTWAKLVRNILTINTCLVHPWKLNQIQASLVLKARQVINFADWCLMTSFMLSCVDAGLMTHSKCNDNDVAGVLPTLQLQIMMARLPTKHDGITRYSWDNKIFSIKIRRPTKNTYRPCALYSQALHTQWQMLVYVSSQPVRLPQQAL